MIQYNTTDIIRKAMQLSDLQNSSFISYEEKLSLLNDAWVKLYNYSIDGGDKLYVCKQTLDAYGQEGMTSYFSLPEDFYQLYSVKDSTGIPYLRKSKNDYDYSCWYDIVNNTLAISNPMSRRVEIEYYPVPETLTIKADKVELKDYAKETVLGMAGNTLAVYRGPHNLVSFDVKTGKQISDILLSDNTVNKALIGRTTFGILYNAHQSAVSGVVGSLEPDGDYNSYNPQYEKLIRVVGEDGTNEVVLSSSLKLNSPVRFADGDIFDQDSGILWHINDKRLEGWEEDKVYDIDLGMICKLEFANQDSIYATNNEVLYVVDICTGDISKVQTPGRAVVSVPKVDYATGYGFLTKANGKYYLESCFENTSLNYPSNLYFSLLAYLLAVSFKVKQDADPTLLASMAADARSQLYDSLERDANQCYRITNVNSYF